MCLFDQRVFDDGIPHKPIEIPPTPFGKGGDRALVSEANTNDEDVIISKLAEYLVKVSQKKDELRDWLYDVPISYQKQSYVVDIAFKCEMGQLVNVMYKIESSFRWLSVRDLKISLADQEKTLLSANMSVLATVL